MDLNKIFSQALNTVYNNKGLCLNFSDEFIEYVKNQNGYLNDISKYEESEIIKSIKGKYFDDYLLINLLYNCLKENKLKITVGENITQKELDDYILKLSKECLE